MGSADRHPAYLERLRSEGTTAIAEVADVLDPGERADVLARITERLGPVEVLYFGPAAMDPDSFPVPIEQVTGGSALHTYALTLNAALADSGVFVGSLVIGGGVQGGDIYTAMSKQAVDGLAELGLDADQLAAMSLDPEKIADSAWHLATERDRAELVFSVID
ncbi:hypothetical protein ACFT2C_24860 [Promicromonospora sp. NPDC057138]|uniref:hypothetical protein n=1 Tax=Promicromonospora sp. NPDC057138 TaxID=3346031 RepID=UPI003628C13A